MSLFAIADLHLAMDPTIEDKAMDMFGGVWVDHARRLESAWKRLVEDEDTVLIPGDISWALKLSEVKADFEFLKTLPGKKIIMKGNHDLWWSSRKKMEAAFPEVFFLQNNCYDGGSFVLAGSRGWLDPEDSNFNKETDTSIYRRELMRIEASLAAAKEIANGRPIIAAVHFPPVLDKGKPTKISKLFTEYGVMQVVYGHLHGEPAISRKFEGELEGVKYKLVSLDSLGAAPFKLL